MPWSSFVIPFKYLTIDPTEHWKSVLACAQIFLTVAGWVLLQGSKFYGNGKKP